MWALKIFFGFTFPLPVFGKIQIKRKHTGDGNRLQMMWWKKIRRCIGAEYCIFIIYLQGLGAGYYWLLQVSSVMMIIIMRSKYFLRPIGTSSFSRIAVVGFSVLSGCESIRRQNFENINLPSRQPDTSQRTGSRRLLASLSNPAAAPHCPTALLSPVRVSLLWTHFKFECWCWWMKL